MKKKTIRQSEHQRVSSWHSLPPQQQWWGLLPSAPGQAPFSKCIKKKVLVCVTNHKINPCVERHIYILKIIENKGVKDQRCLFSRACTHLKPCSIFQKLVVIFTCLPELSVNWISFGKTFRGVSAECSWAWIELGFSLIKQPNKYK